MFSHVVAMVAAQKTAKQRLTVLVNKGYNKCYKNMN